MLSLAGFPLTIQFSQICKCFSKSIRDRWIPSLTSRRHGHMDVLTTACFMYGFATIYILKTTFRYQFTQHNIKMSPWSDQWCVFVSEVVNLQYIPINMHTVFALLCFVVVIHWLIFPYPPGLLHWHCGNLTIAPVPAKQPWWIWINTSFEFIMNGCITTTKQSTTKPCAYFLGYTVIYWRIFVCWDFVVSRHHMVYLNMIQHGVRQQ